jgi:hypothetical protein
MWPVYRRSRRFNKFGRAQLKGVLSGWQIKYVGELCERWLCGTWFERIDDGNKEGNQIDLPVSTKCRCR